MNDMNRLMKKMKDENEKIFAMATIIGVRGSAYRREGARMLIDEDGSCTGTISAGCLEEDLIIQAQEVLESMQPKIILYDLRSEDDLSWGQGAGCDGEIEVYVEPIGWEYCMLHSEKLVWPEVDQLLYERNKLVSMKSLSMGEVPAKRAVYLNKMDCKAEPIGEYSEAILRQYVEEFIKSGENVRVVKLPSGSYLLELYQPISQLLIFGAGPDAEPIVELASKMDFSVMLIDPRSSRCNEKNFMKADALILEHPRTFFEEYEVPSDCYVVVMTHNFEYDRLIVDKLMQNPPKYAGILGPMRRTERLVGGASIPDYIHSPIGISIGAEGPEEISVSVLAELIRLRNQDNGMVNETEIVCLA